MATDSNGGDTSPLPRNDEEDVESEDTTAGEPSPEIDRRADDHVLTVGIGASAGGLEALQNFFDHMPADTGMAFVVVTHLPTGRVSLMPELLARHSSMPVTEISEPTRVEANHVYVARGGGSLGIERGMLLPQAAPPSGGRQLVIDLFFRSLAAEAREHAIGIVLSGTGSDGTLGVK